MMPEQVYYFRHGDRKGTPAKERGAPDAIVYNTEAIVAIEQAVRGLDRDVAIQTLCLAVRLLVTKTTTRSDFLYMLARRLRDPANLGSNKTGKAGTNRPSHTLERG
jgi:hypothetical protein